LYVANCERVIFWPFFAATYHAMLKSVQIYLYAILILCSCGSDESSSFPGYDVPLYADSLPGQSPYLTRSPSGGMLLSWIRLGYDSTPAFCFATAKQGGLFGAPHEIPNTANIQPHGENLPKIVQKPSGEIIALWGIANPNPKNKYSGLVLYAQSFDEGKTWTAPQPLVRDAASFDQRYYDVAVLPDGEAGVVWLDNRKTAGSDGSLVYFTKTDGRNGFGEASVISQPACPCCRTVLYPDSKGNIHVLYRGIIQDSIRDMVHVVSGDGGKTFSAPKRISNDNWVINACPHTGPAMAETTSGLHFTWYTGGTDKGCYYSNTRDNGATYGARVSISPLGSHPQLASLDNGGLVVVWDQFVQVGGKPFRKIGMQYFSEDGAKARLKFITPDTLAATYPVVEGIAEGAALVAYTLKKADNNSYIAYQFVRRD